jgi:hypothetical protein
MDTDRFTRQMRLRDVGIDGQARLGRAALEVHGNEGALVEFLYLCRAGVERLDLLPSATPAAFAHANSFRFRETRSLAAGAWRALGQIRRVLSTERGF